MGTIIIKNSQVAGKVPLSTDLQVGELAVNTNNGSLYTKHSDGSVKQIKGTASELLTDIKTVDGAGSGLDADLLDGLHAVDIVKQSNIGFKNHVINGNFDIWQRGVSQTTDGYGSDDRWGNGSVGSTKTHSRVVCTDTERALFNASAFSRTIVTSVPGVSNGVNKLQRIEDVTKLAGKTITLSFWAKANSNKNIAVEISQRFGTGGSPSAAVRGIGSQLVPLTTTWQKKTITVTLPSIVGKTLGTDGVHTSSIWLGFWLDAGSNFDSYAANLGQQSGTFDIAQVQLEEGSVATPFEQRPYGLELSLCQRYYEKGRALATYMFPSTSQYISRVVEFKVQKRVTPSINISSSGIDWKVRVSDAPAYSTNILAHADYDQLCVSELGTTGVSRNFVEFDYTASAEL